MPSHHVDRDQLYELIGASNVSAVIDAIVVALDEVYEFNRHRHNEEVGDDTTTFGFLVYRNGWAAIEDRLSTVAGVRTHRPSNSLTIVLDNNKRMHVYRGGSDEEYEIDDFDLETGTFTKKNINSHNTRQLSLFGDEEDDEETMARLLDLVVVHTGNPDVGLTGVWIGAPADQADTSSPWVFVSAVYRFGEEVVTGMGIGPSPTPEPFSERLAPVVQLEPRRGSEGASDQG